jgi:hypothetical protein
MLIQIEKMMKRNFPVILCIAALLLSFMAACEKEMPEIKAPQHKDAGPRLPRVYEVVLKQSGNGHPASTVIQNEPGFYISWERISEGRFKGTIDTHLELNKSIIVSSNNNLAASFAYSNEINLVHACQGNRFCDGFGETSINILIFL